MKRWNPRVNLTKKEKFIMKRLKRTRKLFAFLRRHRHRLFDESFQEELEQMYRRTGAGEEPVPPALLCMVLVLQGYHQISDAEAVELSVMDMRWQLVLDCYGAEKPPFSQGGLQQFRERLIAAGMDRRLLERTIELARTTKEFDWKKIPKHLRIAVDSRPLQGAGRVEDTFNLLGHAARKIVECAAQLLDRSPEQVARQAGIPLVMHSSIKAALDVNWSDREQKDEAIDRLARQVSSLQDWIDKKHLELEEPLRPYIEAVAQVQKQDLEETPNGVRLRQGVAKDRRISIEDPDMRHGRKSKSKRFNGYKEHIATDLSTNLIMACAITPANLPEEEAAPDLQADMERQHISIGELQIDRAYVNSTLVQHVESNDGEVVAKPWSLRNSRPGMFTKGDFKINMRDRTITCPSGQIEHFEPGDVVEFDPEVCGGCALRSQCTWSASGRGRTVKIAEDEQRQQRFRKLQQTRKGREHLRERTDVEHRLAHIAARKGPRARYRGTRKNLFDLRRISAIQNLETIQRTGEPTKSAA